MGMEGEKECGFLLSLLFSRIPNFPNIKWARWEGWREFQNGLEDSLQVSVILSRSPTAVFLMPGF